MIRLFPCFCLAALLARSALGQDQPPSAAAFKFFEANVRPVLANRCFQCHGPQKQKGDLRVDSLAGLLEGGKSGPALKVGTPDESLFIQAIRHSDSLQMPPKMKLPPKEIADLAAWVKMGAPWPLTKAVAGNTNPKADELDFTKEQTGHWAFQPVRKPPVPPVKNQAWARSPLDAFILAKLEEKGLTPAPAADPRTLIRRLYFDLIGLPPTPEEIDAFVADCKLPNANSKKQFAISNPQSAITKLVDRLLASPRYGERWARHWLDLVRYADSNGMDENLVFGNAWRYRDYVISAFNADKPYDQFVREQIAGDLLPADGRSGEPSRTGGPWKPDLGGRSGVSGGTGPARLAGPTKNEQLIATAFLCIGPKMLAEDDPVKMEMDIIDEQVDTLGRAFLGMTLGCARCHDHKYDPITIADYYSLAGIFKSTKTMDNFRVVARWQERPVGSTAEVRKADLHAKKIAELKDGIDKTVQKNYKEAQKQLDDLRGRLAKLEKTAPNLPEAMAAGEAKAANLRIHLRGNHLTQGKEMPRQFPRIFASLKQAPIDVSQSGRLQLAQWLTQPGHPLTNRVMVNRLWHWHFGAGLVPSVDNFGLLGERPSHPELLDWLARYFVESGWSIKAMHRLIVLSSAYQMSTAFNEAAFQIDPDNRLHWRHNRRRLEVEALRDALYVLGGNLDLAMGGTLFEAKNRAYVPGYPNTSYDKYDFPRRSIYLPVVRSALYNVFQAFDFADPSFPSGERAITTVAPQALFLMNGKIVHEQTRAWTAKLLADKNLDDAGRVRRIYTQAFGRPPSEKEITQALDFVRRIERERAQMKKADARAQAWQSLCRVIVSANEFVYME